MTFTFTAQPSGNDGCVTYCPEHFTVECSTGGSTLQSEFSSMLTMVIVVIASKAGIVMGVVVELGQVQP